MDFLFQWSLDHNSLNLIYSHPTTTFRATPTPPPPLAGTPAFLHHHLWVNSFVHQRWSVDNFRCTTQGRSIVFRTPLGVGRQFSVHHWGSVGGFRCTAGGLSAVFGAPPIVSQLFSVHPGVRGRRFRWTGWQRVD